MRELTVAADEGCTLWAQTHGTGPVVVLVHGGPGIADNTEALADLLSDDYTVVRYDQRGCGLSPSEGPFSITTSVKDLHAVIDAVSPVRPVHLVGHSWGADLALHAAIARPSRVRSLAYVSGSGLSLAWQDEWIRRRDAYWDRRALRTIARLTNGKRTEAQELELLRILWAPDFAKRLTATKNFKKLTERWHGINYVAHAEISGELAALDAHLLGVQCKALGVPVLVLQGDGDPRPLSALDTLTEALPDVQRTVLPGVGHYAWLENPTATREAIRAHLTARDQMAFPSV